MIYEFYPYSGPTDSFWSLARLRSRARFSRMEPVTNALLSGRVRVSSASCRSSSVQPVPLSRGSRSRMASRYPRRQDLR